VNREAGSACPHRRNLLSVLATIGDESVIEAPVPLVINEPMPRSVACMIEDDRALLVGMRPDRSTALLQEQAQ
jgi:hypothetical protein